MEKPFLIVPTGKLLNDSLDYLEENFIDINPVRDANKRQLYVCLENEEFDLLKVKPKKIPQLLAEGSVQIAITCEDALIESELKSIDVIRKLGFGVCSLEIMSDNPAVSKVPDLNNAAIATSYPVLTQMFLNVENIDAKLEYWPGGVEVATKLGCVAIADLVETGESKSANGLFTIQEIRDVEAVLAVSASATDLTAFDKLRPMQKDPFADIFVNPFTPKALLKLEKMLKKDVVNMADQSKSKELLLQETSEIAIKIGEETAELLTAISSLEKGQILDEAQTMIWLCALIAKKKGLDFRKIYQGSRLEESQELANLTIKGNDFNDSTKELGSRLVRLVIGCSSNNSDATIKRMQDFLKCIDTCLGTSGLTINEASALL